MKTAFQRALWRSRAVAIVGFLVMLLAIFSGLPRVLEDTLFVVFGFLTLSFGLAGSRHKSYAEEEAVKKAESVVEIKESVPAVEEMTISEDGGG